MKRAILFAVGVFSSMAAGHLQPNGRGVEVSLHRQQIGLLRIRGGAVPPAKSKQNARKDKGRVKVTTLDTKKSKLKSLKEMMAQVKPATRVYMILSLLCTFVHMLGLPAPELFALSASRIWELWRPFTAMAYLGGPSMSMANSAYFLVRYGQQLEPLNGLGAHAWFLLVQTCLLSILGVMLGFPNMAQAMIAATVYVSSNLSPMERMPFQFGVMITSWQLPYAMMAIDCLSQQNPAAAWPHVLGIFSGHCFHFFTKVWPVFGGRAWLATPKWFENALGGRPKSNVEGFLREERRPQRGKKASPGRRLGGK